MPTPLGDSAVRSRLKTDLQRIKAPSDLVLDEFGLLNGDVRADVVWVNGVLRGFEIKSQRDRLSRLEGQAAAYGQVMRYATLVVAERHLTKSLASLPAWWGVVVVQHDSSDLCSFRPANENPSVDRLALTRLLWRDEVREELSSRDLISASTKLPCRLLWPLLAEAIPLRELEGVVSRRIKLRTSWRSAPIPSAGDAKCPHGAT